ncbi:hypothetical protein EON65_12435 [archaeon]|nr:MAG: hypothetical protein EON65_12435 [archaeon]
MNPKNLSNDNTETAFRSYQCTYTLHIHTQYVHDHLDRLGVERVGGVVKDAAGAADLYGGVVTGTSRAVLGVGVHAASKWEKSKCVWSMIWIWCVDR